jgi:hypothetical protein
MAADQNLIQATRAMGVSKYRDDSGWVKALASIGKYVASKQALTQPESSLYLLTPIALVACIKF